MKSGKVKEWVWGVSGDGFEFGWKVDLADFFFRNPFFSRNMLGKRVGAKCFWADFAFWDCPLFRHFFGLERGVMDVS